MPQIKQLLSDSLRVVEGSKADPPLATGAAVSVGYVRLKDPPTEDVRERKKPCIS